ncbi:hypothetical protein AVEN_31167-1 [Araneus ventricosus]|uniref:Uncharacterized protein n=1 Tax=Araneus ventricosus TaxID=182803 RepID=A0A4Y2LA36_ARAVE|nr:hypothetical protein AVEN_31167-1 [Araneus ventricosus]
MRLRATDSCDSLIRMSMPLKKISRSTARSLTETIKIALGILRQEEKRSLQKEYNTPKKSSMNECESYGSLEKKTRKQQNDFVGGSIGRKAAVDTPLV